MQSYFCFLSLLSLTANEGLFPQRAPASLTICIKNGSSSFKGQRLSVFLSGGGGG